LIAAAANRNGKEKSAGFERVSDHFRQGAMTSRRPDRFSRPLPQPPAPGAAPGAPVSNGFIAGSRASSGSVVGVVASRLAAMASAGSTTNGGPMTGVVGGGGGGGAAVDSNSRIPSYRLSSLDRLAQRQRLFETQPTNGTSAPLHNDSLQSKREMFFKSDSLASPSANLNSNSNSQNSVPVATTTTSSSSNSNSNGNSNSATSIAGVPNSGPGSSSSVAGTPSSTSSVMSTPTGSIATLKESLLASKENKENNHNSAGPATAAVSASVGSLSNSSSGSGSGSSSSTAMGSKVEALKRELTDDSRDRQILRDRLTDKGPAPIPPAINKTREVDYVGFANLPNQVYRRAVKKGFEFTLMVVGESGLGKSTLINSMFLSEIYSNDYPGPSHRIKKTVQVEQCQTLLKENGVNLTLTVVDTPGFGDAVDNSNCWQPIVDYIESKYEEYLNAESRVQRQPMRDHRVHVCLYFIQPSGHGLKPLDIEFMKRLHDKVNVIPVLAKADTMTPDECTHFKKQVLNEIAQHKIKIYEFPDVDDEELRKAQRGLRERVPFAVVGSNTVVEVDGKKIRGRRYPWGVVEVENMEHCDFIALRNMLIRTHMTDLKEVTNNVHYENFRCRKLAGVGVSANDGGKSNRISNKNPLAQMEEERREHEMKMKKMEQEMEQVFEMKVKEKTQKLKDSEADLQRRHEQTIRSLEAQKLEIEEKRKAFESEKASWEHASGLTLDELRRRSLEASSREQVDGKEKDKEKSKKKKGLF